MSWKDDGTNGCIMPLEYNRLSVHWRYSGCFIEGWKTVPQPLRCTEMPMLSISHFYAKYRSWGKGSAPRGGGGGGGPIHPKKYQEFQAPPKNIWNFSNPKKYPHSVPWPKEETIKCIEMTPKYSPILWWPQKNIHKTFIPPKIFILLKTQKILKFKILNQKNDPSLRMYENIRVPHLPLLLGVSAPQTWVPQPSLILVWPFLCWGWWSRSTEMVTSRPY